MIRKWDEHENTMFVWVELNWSIVLHAPQKEAERLTNTPNNWFRIDRLDYLDYLNYLDFPSS